ncbi:MAG: hypothetical protein RLZZ618_796 [Pseudomonadota bacterium]
MSEINATAAPLSASHLNTSLPLASATNPTHASTSMQGGQAVFENDNYRIVADDNNTVTINNKHTGETYQAWGDPHMKIDGVDTFDFWGTTTFKLEDGTKVTIETTPWKNDPSMTLSSRVTITNGDYGVRISGVDSNTSGDLTVEEGKGWGTMIDDFMADGNVLNENPAGKGFVAIDRNGTVKAVDQAYINATDLKKGGALTEQFKPAFASFNGLVSIVFQGGFIANLPNFNTIGIPTNETGGQVVGKPVFPLPHHFHHHHHHHHGHGFDHGHNPWQYGGQPVAPRPVAPPPTFIGQLPPLVGETIKPVNPPPLFFTPTPGANNPDTMWPGGSPPWKFDEAYGGPNPYWAPDGSGYYSPQPVHLQPTIHLDLIRAGDVAAR